MIVSDLHLDLARSVADDLPESTGSVALAMDVTDRACVDSAVTRVADELGGLDVVVNVAGETFPTASSRRPAMRSGRRCWS